ncbi:MAG: hypothetical protein Q7S65_05570, partial [Nanoarchaeota archaeon]|nr:hypothetical protein [Nanoarchaeota archaeon]
MIYKIALLNAQSGIGVTRGYWEYLAKALHYGLPHDSSALAGIGELVQEHQVDALVMLEAEGESFRSQGLHQVEFASRISGLEHWAFHPTLTLFDMANMGNGVVTRHPMTSSQTHPLTAGIERRGLGSSVISLDGKNLHLLYTHLSLGQSTRR